MKKLISFISILLLCTSCANDGSVPTATSEPLPSPTPTPTVDPEVEKAATLYRALNSAKITSVTEKITSEGSGDLYVERGDLYYEVAEEQDALEAYKLAYKDYLTAYYYECEPDNLSEKMVHIYDALATEAEENNDYEATVDYLDRINVLSPSAETKERLIPLIAKEHMQYANREVKNSYANDLGEEDCYSISKYDDKGHCYELDMYTIDGTLVDTTTDIEYNDYGLLIRQPSIDSNLKFTMYVIYEYDEFGCLLKTHTHYVPDNRELGYTEFEYDSLGRMKSDKTIDGYSGKIHGTTVYLYDSEGAAYGEDVYDRDGNLVYHTIYDEMRDNG